MEKHYHDAFSGAPPLTSNGTLHVLSRVLFLVLCGLWGVTAAQAQDDSYRWVEQNGVYTLTGTAQKGEIATIKVGSFYAPDDHGDATVYFHASGIDTQKDKISLFYPINQDGTGSDTQHGGRIQEGWNNVYLTAQHVEGTTANVQISHIILPTNTTHPIEAMSNIYDINGDGKLEFLGTDFRFHSYQYPGLMPMEQYSIPESREHARLCNLNNDAFPDIRYLEGGTIAISAQEGIWQTIDNVSEAPYPCDYNNDGRIDLMHDNRKIYRQAADGSFSPIEIIPVSSEEDTLVYNRWESQPSSSGIGLGNLGGDVGVAIGGSPSAHVATFSSNREFYSMDFNKDGHADLIDESTGTLLLNRGNNRFLLTPQNGRLYPRDLNGDFIMDYICYDEETQTVESMVFQKDGSIKRQTLMSNLAMDKRIHFYDFNADGYVDVLLPFSHSSATGEYCYLVMAINDGKGNFTINEDNTFHRQLFFIGCADVDNDGCYDILALEKNADRKVLNGWECDLYWLKGSKDMLFKEMPDALIPTQIVQYESSEELNGDAEAYAGDFDNDGFCDILVHSMYFERTSDKLPTASNSFLYSFKQEATAANQSPEKPDMPTLVSDAASGMLQINWQPGKDDLTPTADLTYALRIGTAPGKGDIFYACADEQGHRLNLMPGNMEYNLDKTLNVSGWRKGDYYIAVQTIDAMGKGSAWSDAAVYRHEVAHAPFYIADKDITTADTAIMGYDGPADPSLRYNWDLDGGTIISSEASGSILKVVFDQPGQKHITLSVTDVEGNTSTPRTADLHVSAVRFDKRKLSGLSDSNYGIRQIADIDLDGQPELLAADGVYQPTKEQDFEKAPGIYNTNLDINHIYLSRNAQVDYENPIVVEGPVGVAKDLIFYDLDNNGYLDLVGTHWNSWLYNYGGGKFELQTTDDDNGSYMLFGKDANGKPLFLNNAGDDMSTANSRISNTPPHAPQGLHATQDEDGYLTISWNAAEDAETPACQMRYNLSVKKQGASGEGAFIISPLNGLNNEAAPLPSPLQELTGTQIRIPVSALPVGKYEIQMQSIDRWFATSDFTTPLAVEILPKPLLSLPPRICRDKSATIRYVGTEGRQIQVDFGADATVLDHSDDHTYEVVWSTAGQKTLTVTVDGISSEVSTYVNPPLDATFTLPGITLAHTKTNFEISDDIFMANRSVSFTVKSQDDDDFHAPGHYGISFERKENTKEVRATFTHTGHYTVRMTVEDDGCGNIYQERTIDVLEGMEAPQIALVTVDPTTGKNRINWKFRNLPDYISTVCIYKEGSHYNQFDLIGEAQPSDEGFTDMASNPAVTTSRYRICLNTSFGIPTESGTPHQSVHLTINKGMNGSWNLMWNAYSGRDIDHYRILRGTSPETLTEIATVSGSTQSYTDLTAPEGVVYYAIAYSAYYEDEWQPMKRSLAMASAQSNTASAAQAQNLRLAEELAVTHLEKDAILNEQQAYLHLYAHIYPANASCKNVNWTIIQGEELAYVTPQGLLVAHGTQAGQIIVRATTIDGSQLHQDLTVEKASFPVPVESIRIYPEDELYIDNATGVQRIELAAKIYPEEATNPQVIWNIIEGSEFAYIEEDASGHTYLHATQNGNGTIEVKSLAHPEIRDTRAFHAVGFPGSDIRSSHENTIRIYPAIVTENLHVCHMPAHSEKQIYVIGLDGRCKHAEQTWETDIRIPCHSFPSGVYLLKVVTNGQTVTRKFIKK